MRILGNKNGQRGILTHDNEAQNRRRVPRPAKIMGAGLALVLAAFGTSIAAGYANPLEAVSAFAGDSSDEPSATALDDYTVDTVSPSGTTIDMFDYWITGQNESDTSNPENFQTMGINSDHYLKFTASSYGEEGGNQGSVRNASINAWTGSSTDSNKSGPYTGMVESTLGENGYPTLRSNLIYSNNTNDRTQSQSLAYLFDESTVSGKAAYTNVTGLLSLSEDGYYSYNSNTNFAALNTTTKQFTVYNEEAVSAGEYVSDKQTGQFFPFDSANEVLVEWQGRLQERNNVTSTSGSLNHYFGMHMTSYFMQPTDGKTDNGDSMEFNFSGDDDVWVYIDGVLWAMWAACTTASRCPSTSRRAKSP